MKETRVLKFGGSSFPSLAAYADVAAYIENRLDDDAESVVVVVSAMSGTTGRLLDAALAVDPAISPEITDSLLGTGEIVAACLMRAALERRGIRAGHVSGFQVGITTDSKFTRAKPLAVSGKALELRLRECKVLVVAGGQATDASGRMTMLGRNSSDLSAVILAAALGLPECEIFSDVPGVYSADPYEVPEAAPIREVPYEAIIALSRGGAKVLHHGAVQFARDHRIRIVCRATGSGEIGSVIGRGPMPAAVASNSKISVLRFQSRQDRDDALAQLEIEGIVALPVDLEGRSCLALSQENRGWKEALATVASRHEEEKGWSLVTGIDPVDGISRRLVRQDQCQAEVMRLHAALRPESSFDVMVPELKKFRAAESGLLAG